MEEQVLIRKRDVYKRGLKLNEELFKQFDIQVEKRKKKRIHETRLSKAKKKKLRRLKKALKKQEKHLRKKGVLPKKSNKQQTSTPLPTTAIEYKAEYFHPLWIKRRAQILKRDNCKCLGCDTNRNLQIHHLIYQYGFHVWEYEDRWLVTLCAECHKKAHEEKPIEEFYNKGERLIKFKVG